MRRKLLVPVAATLALAGCLGGGKAPKQLYTLSSEAPPTAEFNRVANAGETLSVDVPVTPKSLKSVRVPVDVNATTIAYVKDFSWVDTPDRLFQQLLSETLVRTTNRVVLDPRQSSLDPGLRVTGTLDRFGYDASTGAAVVRFDAALAATAGNRVETRRFEASEPSAGDAATVAPALNRAANKVARDVAAWVGSHS